MSGPQSNSLGLALTRPVVLIGLMGAGKSSVGRRLANALNVSFADSDTEVELAAGRSVPEIFQDLGEPAFRDGERRVIARLLAEVPGVLATGGGSFINEDTRALIMKNGISVWIDADLDTLWARVKSRPGRPLLETADPKATLAQLLQDRSPVYAMAELTVRSEPDQPHDAVVNRILAALMPSDRHSQ